MTRGGCRGGKPLDGPLSGRSRRGRLAKLCLILRQRKGCAPRLGGRPFKCINNEKSVTGMSADIGPAVTRARSPVELLLIFPPRPHTYKEKRGGAGGGERERQCAVLINTDRRLRDPKSTGFHSSVPLVVGSRDGIPTRTASVSSCGRNNHVRASPRNRLLPHRGSSLDSSVARESSRRAGEPRGTRRRNSHSSAIWTLVSCGKRRERGNSSMEFGGVIRWHLAVCRLV